MTDDGALGDTDVRPLENRHGARMGTNLPVQFTIIGHEAENLGKGEGILSDLSQEGARLTKLNLHSSKYPLEPHFILVSPLAADVSHLWIKVRPIHMQRTKSHTACSESTNIFQWMNRLKPKRITLQATW